MDTPERRAHKRIPLTRAITAFAKSEEAVVGTIVDISKGGISFLCKGCAARAGDRVKMNIMLIDEDIYLPNFACKIISIAPCSEPSEICCGLAKLANGSFSGLSNGQQQQLSNLCEFMEHSRLTATDRGFTDNLAR